MWFCWPPENQAAQSLYPFTAPAVSAPMMKRCSTRNVSIAGSAPQVGSAYPILTAAGSLVGSFASLTEPASGLAPGTPRF